ncbi:MAG: LysR family transcriptional regulator [Rhodospirillales bacterium]|nr:LysR family transcriptional regulator [Rhodospirillales bacterium]
MNWDHLRSFLGAARGGTLSAGARKLGLKHSTIARHVAALEEASSAKLFERSPSGLVLTAAGERLLQTAEAVEADVERAQADIGGRDLAISGSVRIGAPDAFGSFFLAPRLAALSSAHPALSIQLVATPRTFNLTKREADIAVSLQMPERGRLMARKLADYGLGVYAAPSYLERAPRITGKDDLRRHPFINYIDDLIFTPELAYLDEVAPDASTPFQSSSIIAQLNATRAGEGLCILPHFLVAGIEGLVPVLPGRVHLVRTWWVTVHEEQKDLARIRLAIDFIFEQAQRERALLQATPRKRP